VGSFQRLLLACIHFTGGIPGRGTEVTTIKWCNTRHVMRNVFVYQGRLVIITEYTKARGRMNKSFYIVRFLPLLVSQILFQYLVYVRPFAEALSSQAQLGSQVATSLDQYSFVLTRTDDRPFHTNDLSAIISKQTKKVLGTPLATASYRQATLAIAKKHIATIAKPLDPYSARTGSNALLLGVAHQAGHTIQTLMDSYAINKAYPTRLQPELIYQYKIVSELWHQWLQLGQFEQKLKAKRLQDEQTSLDRAATLPPPRRPRGRPQKQQLEAQPAQRAAEGVAGSQLDPPPPPMQPQEQLRNQQLGAQLVQPAAAGGSVDGQPDGRPAQQLGRQLDKLPDQLPDQLPDDELPHELPNNELLDQLPDQLPRLKRMIDDPAQAGHRPTKRQAGARSATAAALPFITPPPTSPAPTYETEARVAFTQPATPTAQTTGNGKGGWVDLTGSPTLIDLTTSPAPARSPLRPLGSSAFNKGLGELQALLDENPWT
jgi:hypothetical protein